MKPRSFAVFAELLRTGSGLVIGPDKVYLLETRLAPILKERGLADLDALAAHVLPGGVGALEHRVIDAMTTNESFFFRDDKPFVHFRTHALPRLHATRPPSARLRIWSAASSAGQEAYSLAMILAECRPQMHAREVEIIGTDISHEQTQRARGKGRDLHPVRGAARPADAVPGEILPQGRRQLAGQRCDPRHGVVP